MTEPQDVLALAAVIRRVDGTHDLGAAQLAEVIIDAGYALVRTPETLDADLHTQEADSNGVWCREDGQRWPCDTVATTPSPTPLEGLER